LYYFISKAQFKFQIPDSLSTKFYEMI